MKLSFSSLCICHASRLTDIQTHKARQTDRQTTRETAKKPDTMLEENGNEEKFAALFGKLDR